MKQMSGHDFMLTSSSNLCTMNCAMSTCRNFIDAYWKTAQDATVRSLTPSVPLFHRLSRQTISAASAITCLLIAGPIISYTITSVSTFPACAVLDVETRFRLTPSGASPLRQKPPYVENVHPRDLLNFTRESMATSWLAASKSCYSSNALLRTGVFADVTLLLELLHVCRIRRFPRSVVVCSPLRGHPRS